MDQTTIDQLQSQLNQLQQDIATAKSRGEFQKATDLEEQAAKIQYQIEQSTSAQAIASTEVISVGGDDYTIDELAADSDSAMIIRQGLRQIKAQVTEKASNWVADVQERDATIQSLKSQLEQLQLEVSDLESKRDAAAQKVDEQQKEIDALKSENEDLRNQIAAGATASSNVIAIESDADLEAAAQRLKAKKEAAAKAAAEAAEASKIRIYDVQQGDLKGSYFTAKRADTDETINIPWTEMNNYVKLSDEEAARFREEYNAAQKAAVDAVPESDPQEVGDNNADAGVAIPPATFQEDSETSQVGGNTPASENVQNVVGAGVEAEGLAVTREEFTALVKRVDELEFNFSKQLNQVA